MEPRAAVLKASFDLAHMVFNAVLADLQPGQAAYTLPGGMVPSAAAVIAHALYGEDMMVSQVGAGPTVLESAGFGRRTGIVRPQPAMTPEWLALAYDLDGLKEYGAAVFARTAGFLESADAATLDRRVATPLGTEVSAAEYLAGFGVVHLAEHTGEVSALKGAQGARGLPFQPAMYDETLAARVRPLLAGTPFTERKMFGGLAFLIGGNMACGIVRDHLMVRTGPAGYEAALARPHTRPMDFTGRPMRGMVFVEPAGLDDMSLAQWVAMGASFAAALPAKGGDAASGGSS